MLSLDNWHGINLWCNKNKLSTLAQTDNCNEFELQCHINCGPECSVEFSIPIHISPHTNYYRHFANFGRLNRTANYVVRAEDVPRAIPERTIVYCLKQWSGAHLPRALCTGVLKMNYQKIKFSHLSL